MQLLPQLADLFHVTLDDLFGREAPQPQRTAEQEEAERTLPWPDDDTLYAVMYHGHQLLTEDPAVLKGHREELRFVYDGPAVIAWKGAGVGLLAIWAATRPRLR